jgi:L-lysine exporter family protein LysE/ArgO
MQQVAAQSLAGMILGLGLITPIGAQNLYVVDQGIRLGFPRILIATLATTTCDAVLILLGTLGLGVALDTIRPLRVVLLIAGVAFLLYLAAQNVRAGAATVLDRATDASAGAIIRRAAGVSLLNPHAILDTVGVIGLVAASRAGADRFWFAFGAVVGSLLWFNFLGGMALAVRSRLTDRLRRAISWVSAVLMSLFALVLLAELLHTLEVT